MSALVVESSTRVEQTAEAVVGCIRVHARKCFDGWAAHAQYRTQQIMHVSGYADEHAAIAAVLLKAQEMAADVGKAITSMRTEAA